MTAPRIILIVPIEGFGTAILDCVSFEDELALRRWVRESTGLPELLVRLLADFVEGAA